MTDKEHDSSDFVSDDSVIDPDFTPQPLSSITIIDKGRKRKNADAGVIDEENNCENLSSSPKRARTEEKIKKTIENKLLFSGEFFSVVQQVNDSKFEKDMVGLVAVCKICNVKIKGALNVTSNFIKHLKVVHPSSYAEYKTMKTKEHSKERCPKTKQDNFDTRVVSFIVDSISPISVVEKKSFIDLFRGTGLHVRSRPKILHVIDDEFERLIGLIKNGISVNKYFCTTADIWSGKKRNNNFKRTSVALACKRFSGAHTFDRIADFIYEINDKFGLNHLNIIATITDNGSNFLKAFREFGVKFSDIATEYALELEQSHIDGDNFEGSDYDEDDLPEFSEETTEIHKALPKHIRCASHTLNLLATSDFIKILKSDTNLYNRHLQAFNKCSNLWNKANRPKTSEIILKTLGIPLITPTVTRWNSLFDAVSRVLSHKEKLQDLCNALAVPKLSQNDLEYLEEYYTIMEPLAATLDFLQQENNLYFGYLIPALISLKTKLKKISLSGKCKLLKNKVISLEENLVNRFKPLFFLDAEVNDAIVASVLCPCIKTQWYASASKIGSIRSLEDVHTTVIRNAAKLTESEDNSFEENMAGSINETTAFFEFDEYESIPNNSSYTKQTKSFSITSKIENELSMYMNDTNLSLDMRICYGFTFTIFKITLSFEFP